MFASVFISLSEKNLNNETLYRIDSLQHNLNSIL